MAKKRHYQFYEEPCEVSAYKPTIFKKVADKVVMTDEMPHQPLSPDSYELDTLISSGVDVSSKVQYEKPNDISQVDYVLGAVTDTLIQNDDLDDKVINKKNENKS